MKKKHSSNKSMKAHEKGEVKAEKKIIKIAKGMEKKDKAMAKKKGKG